jgi:hypothetical protein
LTTSDFFCPILKNWEGYLREREPCISLFFWTALAIHSYSLHPSQLFLINLFDKNLESIHVFAVEIYSGIPGITIIFILNEGVEVFEANVTLAELYESVDKLLSADVFGNVSNEENYFLLSITSFTDSEILDLCVY